VTGEPEVGGESDKESAQEAEPPTDIPEQNNSFQFQINT
jgi:hypothetical protein